MHFDNKYMNIAFNLAKKGMATSFPNPSVGCVIVECTHDFKNDKIAGFGFTQKGGRPHAEAKALEKVNFKKTKKYLCYSTLEPCSHFGRDVSCLDKIQKTPISQIIFALKDPDKRMKGSKIKKLSVDGKIIRSGILKKDLFKFYEGYFLNKIKNRPKITLKMASTLDGKITSSKKKWISNSSSRKIVHHLRSNNDAILVGSNTVKIDNPRLTCRINGLENTSPIRIVINRKLDLTEDFHIITDRSVKTILISSLKKEQIPKHFKKKNIEIINIKNEKFNLKTILKEISSFGINNLLVEGGARTAGFFLKSKFVDELIIFRNNIIVGDAELSLIKFKGNYNEEEFQLKKIMKLKNNILEIYKSQSSLFFLKKNIEKY